VEFAALRATQTYCDTSSHQQKLSDIDQSEISSPWPRIPAHSIENITKETRKLSGVINPSLGTRETVLSKDGN
jgi:hypothetical protein